MFEWEFNLLCDLYPTSASKELSNLSKTNFVDLQSTDANLLPQKCWHVWLRML